MQASAIEKSIYSTAGLWMTRPSRIQRVGDWIDWVIRNNRSRHSSSVAREDPMDALFLNVKYVFRALAQKTGFTFAVVLTLALGIGATSAVFSAVDAVVLRPLSFPNADRLVRISQSKFGSEDSNVSPPRFEDWNRLNSTLESMTGYYGEDVTDTTRDLPERVRRAHVSRHFIEVFGI